LTPVNTVENVGAAFPNRPAWFVLPFNTTLAVECAILPLPVPISESAM
jgi:hypothetical protein